MIYFYARVSTKGQNTDRQLEAAKDYPNVDEIFVDKQSGKNFDRPEYERLKATVVKGDEVIVKVTEIDDQGRLNLSRRDALIEKMGMVPENDLEEEADRKPRGDRKGFKNRRK